MNILSKPYAIGLLLLAAVFTGTGNTSAQQREEIYYRTFYEELQPYGRWVNHRDFGRVWIPRVERNFQPYSTQGRWMVTEYGNTWVSDYEWGWAAFHYGQWFYDDFVGWAWIPGSEWAPAWVDWRSGNGYYGWAPLGPAGRTRYRVTQNHWVFVPQRHICNPYVYNYRVPTRQISTIYYNTTVINNYYDDNNRRYASGPSRDEMERVTRNRVRVYNLNNADGPGKTYAQNNSIRTYRPENVGRRTDDRTSIQQERNNNDDNYRGNRNDDYTNHRSNRNENADRWNNSSAMPQSSPSRPSHEEYQGRGKYHDNEKNRLERDKRGGDNQVNATEQVSPQPDRKWNAQPERERFRKAEEAWVDKTQRSTSETNRNYGRPKRGLGSEANSMEFERKTGEQVSTSEAKTGGGNNATRENQRPRRSGQ